MTTSQHSNTIVYPIDFRFVGNSLRLNHFIRVEEFVFSRRVVHIPWEIGVYVVVSDLQTFCKLLETLYASKNKSSTPTISLASSDISAVNRNLTSVLTTEFNDVTLHGNLYKVCTNDANERAFLVRALQDNATYYSSLYSISPNSDAAMCVAYDFLFHQNIKYDGGNYMGRDNDADVDNDETDDDDNEYSEPLNDVAIATKRRRKNDEDDTATSSYDRKEKDSKMYKLDIDKKFPYNSWFTLKPYFHPLSEYELRANWLFVNDRILNPYAFLPKLSFDIETIARDANVVPKGVKDDEKICSINISVEYYKVRYNRSKRNEREESDVGDDGIVYLTDESEITDSKVTVDVRNRQSATRCKRSRNAIEPPSKGRINFVRRVANYVYLYSPVIPEEWEKDFKRKYNDMVSGKRGVDRGRSVVDETELEDLKRQRIKEIFFFKDERNLLVHFVSSMITNSFVFKHLHNADAASLLTGYNVIGYDLPVIFSRLCFYGFNQYLVLLLSLRGRFHPQQILSDAFAIIKRRFTMHAVSLNQAGETFCGRKKEDLNSTLIRNTYKLIVRHWYAKTELADSANDEQSSRDVKLHPAKSIERIFDVNAKMIDERTPSLAFVIRYNVMDCILVLDIMERLNVMGLADAMGSHFYENALLSLEAGNSRLLPKAIEKNLLLDKKMLGISANPTRLIFLFNTRLAENLAYLEVYIARTEDAYTILYNDLSKLEMRTCLQREKFDSLRVEYKKCSPQISMARENLRQLQSELVQNQQRCDKLRRFLQAKKERLARSDDLSVVNHFVRELTDYEVLLRLQELFVSYKSIVRANMGAIKRDDSYARSQICNDSRVSRVSVSDTDASIQQRLSSEWIPKSIPFRTNGCLDIDSNDSTGSLVSSNKLNSECYSVCDDDGSDSDDETTNWNGTYFQESVSKNRESQPDDNTTFCCTKDASSGEELISKNTKTTTTTTQQWRSPNEQETTSARDSDTASRSDRNRYNWSTNARGSLNLLGWILSHDHYSYNIENTLRVSKVARSDVRKPSMNVIPKLIWSARRPDEILPTDPFVFEMIQRWNSQQFVRENVLRNVTKALPENVDEKYKEKGFGGGANDAIPGVYLDVESFDFESYYPSMARENNLSVETVTVMRLKHILVSIDLKMLATMMRYGVCTVRDYETLNGNILHNLASDPYYLVGERLHFSEIFCFPPEHRFLFVLNMENNLSDLFNKYLNLRAEQKRALRELNEREKKLRETLSTNSANVVATTTTSRFGNLAASIDKELREIEILKSDRDAKQLMYKLIANSLFGYTGYERSKFKGIATAAAITLMCQNMCMQVARRIMLRNFHVIYIDTDGLMICGSDNERTTLALLKDLNEDVCGKGYLKLARERFTRCVVVMSKKKYVKIYAQKEEGSTALPTTYRITSTECKGFEKRAAPVIKICFRYLSRAIFRELIENDTCGNILVNDKDNAIGEGATADDSGNLANGRAVWNDPQQSRALGTICLVHRLFFAIFDFLYHIERYGLDDKNNGGNVDVSAKTNINDCAHDDEDYDAPLSSIKQNVRLFSKSITLNPRNHSGALSEFIDDSLTRGYNHGDKVHCVTSIKRLRNGAYDLDEEFYANADSADATVSEEKLYIHYIQFMINHWQYIVAMFWLPFNKIHAYYEEFVKSEDNVNLEKLTDARSNGHLNPYGRRFVKRLLYTTYALWCERRLRIYARSVLHHDKNIYDKIVCDESIEDLRRFFFEGKVIDGNSIKRSSDRVVQKLKSLENDTCSRGSSSKSIGCDESSSESLVFYPLLADDVFSFAKKYALS